MLTNNAYQNPYFVPPGRTELCRFVDVCFFVFLGNPTCFTLFLENYIHKNKRFEEHHNTKNMFPCQTHIFLIRRKSPFQTSKSGFSHFFFQHNRNNKHFQSSKTQKLTFRVTTLSPAPLSSSSSSPSSPSSPSPSFYIHI